MTTYPLTRKTYPGVYRARCVRVDDLIWVEVPQIFGDVAVPVGSATGEFPAPSNRGWVAFEGGHADRPVWVSARGATGPAGIEGEAGVDGADGSDGADGDDFNGDARLDAIEANGWVTAARTASPLILSLTRTTSTAVTTGAQYVVSWENEVSDPSGFITAPGTVVTVPSGLGGLYSVVFKSNTTSGPTTLISYVDDGTAGGVRYFTNVNTGLVLGKLGLTYTLRLVPTNTVTCLVINATAGSLNYTFEMAMHRLSS